MNGHSIAAQALADAALRNLASEYGGPRPAAARIDRTAREHIERRTSRASRP
jgi:phage terminase large subunit-like protein